MNYDIPESVSQGSYGAYDEENRRIHEVADELRRRSKLYETQLRDSQDDVNHLDIEQRVAEDSRGDRHLGYSSRHTQVTATT